MENEVVCVCVCVCVCAYIYIYIYIYIYVTDKKNKAMPFAATWMDLEVVTLSEASQTQKDKYMISLTCGILKKGYKLIYKIEMESQM